MMNPTSRIVLRVFPLRHAPLYFRSRIIRREYLLKNCMFPCIYNFIKYCVEFPIIVKLKQSIARRKNEIS